MFFASFFGLTFVAFSGALAAQASIREHHARTVPAELWSSLVTQKVARTAANVSTTSYVQLTDRVNGKWIKYGVDYWTSGFLPVHLYAMHRREELCPSLKSGTNWLELGREWSLGLLSLIPHNTVGHDVGFLSFPFFEELKM
jgi:hypothetical protein